MKLKGLQSLLEILYPQNCVCCDGQLQSSELVICISCRHDLPLLDNHDYQHNLVVNTVRDEIPIEFAAAFFVYTKTGKIKNLIHQLKYKGRQDIGSLLGTWMGHVLKGINDFRTIDLILPIPLHKKKEQQRGYNQLTTFGKALSKELNIPFREDLIVRPNVSVTQTFKKRYERFLNTQTQFKLVDKKPLENLHVLLIDDVITTGATLKSCCRELNKVDNIKISVFAMAYTL